MRGNRDAWGTARRLAGFAVLLAVLLLLLRRDEPRPAPAPVSLPIPSLDPNILDLELTRNITLRLQPASELPAAEPPPPPPPPAPAPPPASAAAPPPPPTAEANAGAIDSTPAVAAVAPPALEEPESATAPTPAELCLRPRRYVQPFVPERVIRKRKIDDSVLLQSYVGSDGRVQEVRVLHRIPNCDECNDSAIAAAQGFVYDVPFESGGVWTTPFELHFTYRR